MENMRPNSTVERVKCACGVVLLMLAILGNAESNELGSGCARGNASEWPSLHVKYRKRSIAIVSDITGNVDKFSAIGVKINALSTGLDDSMIYIFEGSEAKKTSPTGVEKNKTSVGKNHPVWSLELSCPNIQLNLNRWNTSLLSLPLLK